MMSSDQSRQTVALAFHKLTSSLTYGSTNYSPSRLAKLLQQLRDHGLLQSELSGGEAGVEITFDDGYAHLVDTLPPLIEEFGIQPTIFVPTAWIGRGNVWDYSTLLKKERHLNAQEIRQLSLQGARFGSHGHSHRALTSLDDDRLIDDLSRSRTILEDILGEAVTTISYPFGQTDDRVVGAAHEAGYRRGFTMTPPGADDNDLLIGRIPVYFFDTATMIMQRIRDSGLSPLWHGLGRFATALSSGTILLHKLGLLRSRD